MGTLLIAPSSLRRLSHCPCLSSQTSPSPGPEPTGDSIPLGVEGLLQRVERGDVTVLLKEWPPLMIYTYIHIWTWETTQRRRGVWFHCYRTYFTQDAWSVKKPPSKRNLIMLLANVRSRHSIQKQWDFMADQFTYSGCRSWKESKIYHKQCFNTRTARESLVHMKHWN